MISMKMPKQKVSSKGKTKKWFKDCITSGVNIALDENNSIKPSNETIKRNLDLYDGIVDNKEVKKQFDSLNLFKSNYNPSFKHFSTIRDRVELLVGEYIERGEDYIVAALNEDAINKKLKEQKGKVKELISEMYTMDNIDSLDLRSRLEELNASKYRSKDELAANKLLEFYKKQNNIDFVKVEGLREALITAVVAYNVDIVGNELKIRKCSPDSIYPVRNGTSNDIRDSEMIAEVRYLPIGKVLDEFELTTSQLDKLLKDGLYDDESSALKAKYETTFNSLEDLERFSNSNGIIDNRTPVDSYGNIRVVKFVWAGFRKIYKRKYYDNNGDTQYDYKSEYYEADIDSGEVLTVRWIKEWHEGYLLKDDIVVGGKVRDMQYRSLNNPSVCFSGYVGGFFNVSNNKAVSMVDLVAPYLYMRDMIFARIEDLMSKNMGKLIEIDLSMKPNSWSSKKWLYYIKSQGLIVVNRFNEGTKGVAQGKLAGQYSQGMRAVDAELGGSIESYVGMLNVIDSMISRVTGIPEQRLGAIKTRELVGNVERSRIQSSHITEYWFKRYENIMLDLYSTVLDTAKLIINDDVRLQTVLDDLSFALISSKSDDFRSTEFGLFPINSLKYSKLRSILEEISINAVPNGQMTIEQLNSVFRSNNISEMSDKLERYEANKERTEQLKAEKEQKDRMEAIQKQQDFEMAKDTRDKEHEKELKRIDIAGKLELESMKLLDKAKSEAFKAYSDDIRKADEDGDGIDDAVELVKQEMVNKQKDKELKLKEKELDIKKREVEIKREIGMKRKS